MNYTSCENETFIPLIQRLKTIRCWEGLVEALWKPKNILAQTWHCSEKEGQTRDMSSCGVPTQARTTGDSPLILHLPLLMCAVVLMIHTLAHICTQTCRYLQTFFLTSIKLLIPKLKLQFELYLLRIFIHFALQCGTSCCSFSFLLLGFCFILIVGTDQAF